MCVVASNGSVELCAGLQDSVLVLVALGKTVPIVLPFPSAFSRCLSHRISVRVRFGSFQDTDVCTESHGYTCPDRRAVSLENSQLKESTAPQHIRVRTT